MLPHGTAGWCEARRLWMTGGEMSWRGGAPSHWDIVFSGGRGEVQEGSLAVTCVLGRLKEIDVVGKRRVCRRLCRRGGHTHGRGASAQGEGEGEGEGACAAERHV